MIATKTAESYPDRDIDAATSASEDAIRAIVSSLSLDAKVRLLTGADHWRTCADPSIGLQAITVSDGPQGVRGTLWDDRYPSDLIPCPTALAATWDDDLVADVAGLMADDARRKGVDVVLAPVVNLHRAPNGGRHFECFSEDPLLSGRLGAAFVSGLQHRGIGCSLKHFVANDSEEQRFTLNVNVAERTLREVYLAPFEYVVTWARPWSVMSAYNGVNGLTMTANPIQQTILKDEWGFDGVVVSDWYAARDTVGPATAGLDLVMPGPGGPWGDALEAAVTSGEVPVAAIDDKVARLLRTAARSGRLRGVSPDPVTDERILDATALLRKAAAASFVLARNEGSLLPLDPGKPLTVAILGPNAAHGRALGGGSAMVYPPYIVSPLDGLRDRLEDRGFTVTHAAGVRSSTRPAIATDAHLIDPVTGEPGMRVRYFGADDTELLSEHRRIGMFIWLDAISETVAVADVRRIDVEALVRADRTGEHIVGISANGPCRLDVDGGTVFDDVLALPADADPIEYIIRPAQALHRTTLAAGDRLPILISLPVKLGSHKVFLHVNYEEPTRPQEEEFEAAIDLARAADVAIVVVGTNEEIESEGMDRPSLELSGGQQELVAGVTVVNPRTIVVVNAGSPVALPWLEKAPATLLTWFPGQEFGNALADVVLGLAEPGGRSPQTWPGADTPDGVIPDLKPVDGQLYYNEGLQIGYRAWLRDGATPAIPFGHGHGYTEWAYEAIESIELDGTEGDRDVSIRLRNVGDRPGRETVQIYVEWPQSTVDRPTRALVGFATCEAESGAATTVTVKVIARTFEHWDETTRSWAREPGSVRLLVGRSVDDIRLTADLVIR